MNSTSASESGTEDFYKKLWEEVQEHNPIQSTMEGRVAEPSQTPVHTQTSSIGWRSRQLQSHLEQAYNIYLVLDLTDHVLPKDSFHQDPSSEHMYLKKTDEECEIIAAQILRIKQCEENESTLISYLNSSLLPWPLVYHHPILGRIHDRPIFEISTLEEPPLHQQNNNNQYFSWKIIPDILYLYNVGRFEKNDILALKGLGLSKNIIALNGEFKSEAGSALQARTQLICAGVLVLWQRIKIRKAAACSDTSDLSHYCFSMCSGDFEFWCLKHVDDAFHAQQYACGTLINAAGVRKFIEIWNCVINHVIGSQWESLRTDIRPRVVVTSNHRDNWASRLRQRGQSVYLQQALTTVKHRHTYHLRSPSLPNLPASTLRSILPSLPYRTCYLQDFLFGICAR